MGDAKQIHQVTPFLHVPDIGEAAGFFVDLLGFECLVREGGYAYVQRDGAGVRLLEIGDPAEAGVPHRGFGVYFDVADIDAIAAEIVPKLADRPDIDTHGPIDQPYGQREFMVRGPDGNVIAFGAPIRKEDAAD